MYVCRVTIDNSISFPFTRRSYKSGSHYDLHAAYLCNFLTLFIACVCRNKNDDWLNWHKI